MRKNSNLRANIALGLIFAFLANTFGPVPLAQAQNFCLTAPGAMVRLSPEFKPAVLRGLSIHKNDPFSMDFFINKGEQPLSKTEKKEQYQTLVKYFLAALAIPDEDQWVNLSPYEKNRIIADNFSRTTMGRDLLTEDYMLKQITASLIYPEDEIGKKFWKRIYEEAQKKFGTTNIPVNTFNKVWIVPQKAVVYENAKSATVYIVESKLKVMLEQDYLALEKNQRQPGDMFNKEQQNVSPSTLPNELELNAKAPQGNNRTTSESVNALGSQIVREIVIPELTKEVNEGKNFAQLRQIYSAMILATWYKKALKKGILDKIYTDKAKVKGIDQDPKSNEVIYQYYLKAFKKGVYNYIKEEKMPNCFDSMSGCQTVARKYFSGGFSRMETRNAIGSDMLVLTDPAQLSPSERSEFETEASASKVDRVTEALTPMMSKARSKNLFAEMALGFVMAGILTPDLKAIPPEDERLIEVQAERWGVKTDADLNKEMEKSLNNIFNLYIAQNREHLLTPIDHMPYLSYITKDTEFKQYSLPYSLLSKIVKKRVAVLNEKQKNGNLSPAERNELNGLRFDSVLFIQKVLILTSHYNAKQHTVQGLIVGNEKKREFNCESISIATVIIARDWGFDGVFVVDMKELANGRTFPELINGVLEGHVANVILAREAPVKYVDQGSETVPRRVILYDKKDGNPIIVEGNQIASAPNASPRSLDDLILDQEIYLRTKELFGLLDVIRNQIGNNQSDQVNETLKKIEELMPWIEANTEAINRNPDLEKYNIMAAIAEVKEIKANMSTPVIPENNTSYAVRKTLEADMDQADNLYKQGRFGQAKEIYDKITLTAASEYDRLNALKNKLSAGKDSPMMRYFSAIADIAKKRSADAQQHAVTTEHFEVYKKFLDEINSLNNEAITENKTNDYQAASEHLAAIYKLINDNIDNMRKQLENVQGVADDKGNPVSAQELIENLSKAADKAKENQNIVLNNLLNSLISRCDHLLKYPAPDKSKMKGEMMSIAKEAKEILDSQGKDMNTELKGKFNKLIGLIYRDSAMVIPIQPVGGIDFNSKNLDLQIEGDIGSFALSVDPAVWDNIKVQGLVPTIIEIKPVTDWGVF